MIESIHHTGHVVGDLRSALDAYQTLGFNCDAPTCPVFASQDGEPGHRLGVANAHIPFEKNFIELVAIASDEAPLPPNTELVRLVAPAGTLDWIVEDATRTVLRLREQLAGGEGIHILVFGTPNLDACAHALDEARISHGPIQLVSRTLITASGRVSTPVRLVELDTQSSPEGRLAIAENTASDIANAQTHLLHPNGALELDEVLLCVPDEVLSDQLARYNGYLGRQDAAAGRHTFELSRNRVTLVAASKLEAELPGERIPATTAFVGFAVLVADISETERWLSSAGIPVSRSPHRELYVPAANLRGTAVIFRQAWSA